MFEQHAPGLQHPLAGRGDRAGLRRIHAELAIQHAIADEANLAQAAAAYEQTRAKAEARLADLQASLRPEPVPDPEAVIY